MFVETVEIVKIIATVILLPIIKALFDLFIHSKSKVNAHIEHLATLLLEREKYEAEHFKFLVESAFSKYLKTNVTFQEIEVLLSCDSPNKAFNLYSKANFLIEFNKEDNKFSYSKKVMTKPLFGEKRNFSVWRSVAKGLLLYFFLSGVSLILIVYSTYKLSLYLSGAISFPILAIGGLVGAITLIVLAIKMLNSYTKALSYGEQVKTDLEPNFIVNI